jgi:hypothetical protein
MHWTHAVVVRPTFTYAVTVQWPGVRFKTSRAELSKLYRLTCFSTIEAMRTAPTIATEVLLGLPPMHLQLEAEA